MVRAPRRAQLTTVVGVLAVVAYAAVAGLVLLDTVRTPGSARPERGAGAASAFVEAWERSRFATFVTEGTVERRSEITGAVLAAEEVVAQRPPRRLRASFGGIEGRDDDRILLCPADHSGEHGPCSFGRPGGPTYAESVRAEVEALDPLVRGPDPLYSVVATADGCFDLALRRVEPRAPYGRSARFCFDPVTGAPAGRRVVHDGGVVEVAVAVEIRSEVTDADLEP